MDVLVATVGSAGHFQPLVPFMAALLRNGHEVTVAGPPRLRETVDDLGFAFVAANDAPDHESEELWSRVHRSETRGAGEAVVVGEIFAGLHVRALLPVLLDRFGSRPPDLVLRETYEFASAIAADEAGVPHVRVATGLAETEQWSLGLSRSAIETVRPGIVASIEESPYLTLFPASLESDPRAFRRTHRFRAEDEAPDELPRWWADDSKPLVYVSFGSVFGTLEHAAGVYRAALDAVEPLAVRTLLTVGRGFDPSVLQPVDGDVRIEQWVPQADVFPHASAVVCHGGSGTTLGALGAGLPLVVAPMFADQPRNARCVAAAGAGVSVISPGEDALPVPEADEMRAALELVLTDQTYRAAARRIAAEMQSHPPLDAAVSFLEALAAGG